MKIHKATFRCSPSQTALVLQDIFERGNVHLLPVQTVHAIGDSDIADIVAREEDFDVAASLDVVPAQARKILRDNALDLTSLNVSNHPLERRTVERRR